MVRSQLAGDIRPEQESFQRRGTLITTRRGQCNAGDKSSVEQPEYCDRFITPSCSSGLREYLADDVLRRIAREQADDSHGRIRGLIRKSPFWRSGKTAVGRFGGAARTRACSFPRRPEERWASHPLSTNDNTLLGDPVDDESQTEDTGDIRHRCGVVCQLHACAVSTASSSLVIPRNVKRSRKIQGIQVHRRAACHVTELVTGARAWVNGELAPKALGK